MPEDRFGDLGGGQPEGAADHVAKEERSGPDWEPPPRRPEMASQGNRYAWLVALLLLMGISVLLLTTAIPNRGKGVRGLEPGALTPDFATPTVDGDKEGDANVCQRAGECNDQAGPVPACAVRSEGIFNVCEARKRPLVLTFLFDKGADCNPQVDRVQRMKHEFPGVNFAVVFFSKEDRGEVAAIARRRGWTMPVAFTKDAAVVNLYGVGGCPTTVFVRRGGRVLESVLGPISEDELRQRARRLLRHSWW